MTSSLNIQLTRRLRQFVDERASDSGVYATPSEYVCDLIRRDMQAARAARELAIASALNVMRASPTRKLEPGFIDNERRHLKERSLARRK